MERPYPEELLLPYEEVMLVCTPIAVNPRALIPTQEFAVIDRLLAINAGKDTEGPDIYAHLVKFEERLYIHNGHHRWLIDLIRGYDEMLARVQSI
jgi:hypothetical protein